MMAALESGDYTGYETAEDEAEGVANIAKEMARIVKLEKLLGIYKEPEKLDTSDLYDSLKYLESTGL